MQPQNQVRSNKLQNFIGGEFIAPSNGRYQPHANPATAEVSVEFPDSELLDLVKAIQAANKSWAAWQRVESEGRAKHLLAIADELERGSDEPARIQSRDQGTPIAISRKDSLPKAVEIFRFHARLLLDETMAAAVGASGVFLQNRLPIGLVAVITPWSDPFVALASRVAPALAAGNVVIAKPSEFAPESAEAFARAVAASGLPPGVFNMVQGRGETVGAAIATHPGISTIAFMGRTETGRSLLRESSEFLKRTHLALGARNPMLVFADTELEKVMPQVVECALHTQSTVSARGSRVFVQESVYDKFLELFKAELEKVVIGDPLDEKTRLGPMISAEERKRFFAAIEQGLGEKGKLLTGGTEQPTLAPGLERGNFVRPTAIHDLTLCSTLQQEEVLGPFVTIASFKYQHDAVKHANNSPLGQAAYLFHRDATKAMKIAQKIEAGRVFLNTGRPLWDARAPFGGLKTSGLGREGGASLLAFFSRETMIAQGLG